jgi:tetratricopeptide (TPR) repeat protein
MRHYYLGRQAIVDHDWDTAIREFKATGGFKFDVDNLHKAVKDFRLGLRDPVVSKDPMVHRALTQAIHESAKMDRVAAETDKYLKMALAEKAKQESARQAAQQAAAQASNPNYPKPPPIYRDASTPRSYPKLKTYTKAQNSAHHDNETGNLMAQTGDWVEAMLAYQKALFEDPNGPFTDVIKRNLDLARSHLGPAKPAKPAAAPAPVDSTTLVRHSEPLKDVAAPDCTNWMTQHNGSKYRLCMDEKAQHYCEQAKDGAVSRVTCQ